MSEDHKPSSDKEKKRILKFGGRIEKAKDENGNFLGPYRVWLPKRRIIFHIWELQGLAMSRSFGDNISKPVGVTHEPDILQYTLDKKDKFMLIASDGVW